jgi:hypothetical protein
MKKRKEIRGSGGGLGLWGSGTQFSTSSGTKQAVSSLSGWKSQIDQLSQTGSTSSSYNLWHSGPGRCMVVSPTNLFVLSDPILTLVFQVPFQPTKPMFVGADVLFNVYITLTFVDCILVTSQYSRRPSESV